jgi:hypothetical protein
VRPEQWPISPLFCSIAIPGKNVAVEELQSGAKDVVHYLVKGAGHSLSNLSSFRLSTTGEAVTPIYDADGLKHLMARRQGGQARSACT